MRSPDKPGPVASRLLRAVAGYQRARQGHPSPCRFTPSCSVYATEALRTRRLPVALLLIGWRLVRCNPMAHRIAADPVQRRTHRWRPNAVPTALSVLALSGLVVVGTAAIAQAVGVSGGCTATINGKSPSQLDSAHPLVVHKGEVVAVTGTAPTGVSKSSTNNTHIDVEIVEGVFGVSSSDHPGTGATWGGTQNVDKYLKYGVGLYHVKGVAEGSTGWKCTGDAYVRLKDGNPLTKPIGAGGAALAVVGGVGAALAARGKPQADYDVAPPKETPEQAEESKSLETANRVVLNPRPGDEALLGLGCLVLILLFFGGGSWMAYSATAPAVPLPAKRRVWAHGHPVAGFIAGLFAGIGLAVVLQQFAVAPLTILTAIIFPVIVAVLCALRAYLGRPYEVVEG